MKFIKHACVFALATTLAFNTITVNAADTEENYKIVDDIIEEIDYSSYNDENINVQFMNDFLDKLHTKHDFKSVQDFDDYAKDNYECLTCVNKNINNYLEYNSNNVHRSKDINVMIYNDEFYVLHYDEDLPRDLLVASCITENVQYKKTYINYSLVEKDASIYTITLNNRKLPLQSISLNSSYGYRTDPINGETAYHSGMDLQASMGDPIYATESGTCHICYSEEGYGNHIEIEHEDGISTLYAHCSELLVSEGQVVAAGELIARVGSTGRSTGPHLHFEYRVNGEPNDPTDYLQGCE